MHPHTTSAAVRKEPAMTTDNEMPSVVFVKLYASNEGTCSMDATPFDMEGRTRYTNTETLIRELEGMKVPLPENYDDKNRQQILRLKGHNAAIDAMIAKIRGG